MDRRPVFYEQERVLGVPRFHSSIVPNTLANSVVTGKAPLLKLMDPVTLPSFIDMTFTALTRNSGAEKDRRCKRREETEEILFGRRVKMFCHLQAYGEVEFADAFRRWTIEISGPETVSRNVKRLTLHIVSVDAQHFTTERHEGGRPCSDAAADIDNALGTCVFEHHCSDYICTGSGAIPLASEELG